MSKFQVTYPNGDTAEHQSGHESVEAFCNDHFGSAWEAAEAAGAKVVMDGAEPAADGDDVAAAPAKAKPAKKRK